MKLYLVEEYSDDNDMFNLRGVYTTSEAAENAAELFFSESRIKQVELDAPPLLENTPLWVRAYHVKIDRNLNIIEVKLNFQSPYFCDFWGLDFRVFEFFAKNEAEAERIAKEKAIELIESGEWDNPKEEEE